MNQKRRKRDQFPYILLSPAMLVTILIIFIPIVRTLSFSLYEYVLWKPHDKTFVGLGNYLAVWSDEIFYLSLRNTVVWIVGVIALQLLLGFATALLLNRNFAWRGLARSLILIPWVTPSVITGLMWRWMYDGNQGLINDLLVRVGLLESYFPWLADNTTALWAIIVALMWQGFPFFAIMILAGLQAIPAELIEAAEMDGAGRIQLFIRVTLPMLRPVLYTSLLLRTIWVANSLDVIYIMTGGGPGYSTHTLPVFSYVRAYKAMDFGYASTLAVYLTILLVGFVIFYVRRVVTEEAR